MKTNEEIKALIGSEYYKVILNAIIERLPPPNLEDRLDTLKDRITALEVRYGQVLTEIDALEAESVKAWKPTPGRDAMTRDGRRVTELRWDGEEGLFFGTTSSLKFLSWGSSGEYNLCNSSHDLDLVADWPEEQPTPKPDFNCRRFSMKAVAPKGVEPWVFIESDPDGKYVTYQDALHIYQQGYEAGRKSR